MSFDDNSWTCGACGSRFTDADEASSRWQAHDNLCCGQKGSECYWMSPEYIAITRHGEVCDTHRGRPDPEPAAPSRMLVAGGLEDLPESIEHVLCAICNTYHTLDFDCLPKPVGVSAVATWLQQRLPFGW